MALGNAYPAITLDENGRQVDSTAVVQFTDDTDQPGSGGGGGGLALTGWSEDASDPANVDTNDGSLELGGGVVGSQIGTVATRLQNSGVESADTATGSDVVMSSAFGMYSKPPPGNPAFLADGGAGATVAFDAAGLLVVGFQGLPTSDPGTPGALYTTAGALMVSL